MPQTPDRDSGERLEEGVTFDDRPAGEAPTNPGQQRFIEGAWQFVDDQGVFDPRQGGTGMTEAQHKVLRQGIHFIDSGPAEGFASGAYRETTWSGIFLSTEIWYTAADKTKKIVELSITTPGITPAEEIWKIYDTDGTTVLATLTDAIVYSGLLESNRTRTIT